MNLKTLSTLLFIVLSLSIATLAQKPSNAQLGKVTYMEGKAELIAADQVVTPVTINTLVYGNQSIKTAGKSMVEISWSNGSKTTIEPLSNYSIGELYSQSGGQALAQSESVFAGFKKAFRAAGESKRVETGGIRRSKGTVDSMPALDQLYWKEDKEITFDEASAFYDKGDFVKAVWAFKTFLDQKPMNEMAKYATFALGHSYLRINNQAKARELFEQFVVKYSNDELRTQAEAVLAKFPAVH